MHKVLFISLLFLSSIASQEKVYVVKSSMGEKIFETTDSVMVSEMINVIVDTTFREIQAKVYRVPDSVQADSMRAQLISYLGKPTYATYYYDLAWDVDSLYVSLIKEKGRFTIVTSNQQGRVWLKAKFLYLK
jgi:hypothetical protein